MNVREYYAYLTAAREQLWNYLRALPQADLDRNLIEDADRFHSIKDLLLHVTDVEDHWVHGIVLGDGVQGLYPHDWVRPQAQQYDLGWILDYSREVTRRTCAFLDSEPDLHRSVKLVQDDPASDTVTLDQLMWNVMTHEVRHTAQIALMIRQLGHTPPWLDYMRFVRPQSTSAQAGAPDLDDEPDDSDEL
ncbi:damage-inducible protein DinB [Deinococcus arenae]|uniref:Damage-inducible protein DinB n=1 Tax=Deinococcus arenae TaxID=1452751 RepID=A0A8H9L880_9DEIO|nr:MULTISPECIES: DinB family protein [Deinococcus]AWT36574.1 damage-inducible protein DinB [Deinococcus actinosclerus]GGM42472.1 damage-inducible protein DinB [Deinococcus arenae]